MENPADKVLVFVYGSLLSELHNHRYLEHPGVELVGEDSIDGRIYQVHWSYPALDKEGAGIVKGEVYSIPPQVLVNLDRLESYYPERPDQSQYTRSRVATHGGRTVIVYSMGSRMKEFFSTQPHIESGDWRARYKLNQEQALAEQQRYQEEMERKRAARKSKTSKKK